MITTIGQRMKNIRIMLNLSQEEFGEQIGITRSAVCTYEKNRRQPREKILELICKKFSVNIDYLQQGKGEMFKIESMSIDTILSVLEHVYNLTEQDKSIIVAYLQLSKEERAIFTKYLNSIK